MTFLKHSLLTALSLILLWVAGFIAFSAYALGLKPENPEASTEAIVVLTGGPGRIEEGLELFSLNRAPKLFITGVHNDTSLDDILGKWHGKRALPACCITLGHQANSTTQNAQETYEWLSSNGYQTIRLVTGNYHMPRAHMELSHMLRGVKIYSHPIKQDDLNQNHHLLFNLLFSEYHKTLYRWTALFFEPVKTSSS